MKNNIRLLTKEELLHFKEKYLFEINGPYVIITCSNFNRPTMHSKDFFLKCNGRKININWNTVNIWNNYYKNVHLVELQNIINQLTIMYQEITPENIDKLLRKDLSYGKEN